MAGIGDSLKATTDAIWGAVSASIAMGGSIMGAIMYEIFEILYYYVLGYYAYVYGYNRGMSFLTDVNKSGILDKLMDAASIVGMMAVGALIPSWCSFNLNNEFIINDFIFFIPVIIIWTCFIYCNRCCWFYCISIYCYCYWITSTARESTHLSWFSVCS